MDSGTVKKWDCPFVQPVQLSQLAKWAADQLSNCPIEQLDCSTVPKCPNCPNSNCVPTLPIVRMACPIRELDGWEVELSSHDATIQLSKTVQQCPTNQLANWPIGQLDNWSFHFPCSHGVEVSKLGDLQLSSRTVNCLHITVLNLLCLTVQLGFSWLLCIGY